jgi:recombinational DNA repair protein (RecF pathway)
MSRRVLAVHGVVLARRETAGGFERLDLLAPGQGLLACMRRVSQRKGQVLPDLFDVCACVLEARESGAWFVKEYELLRRHGGIGARYAALREAGAWARIVLANAPHMESVDALHALTLQALDAWERGGDPEAVLLKALYVFGRDEGLPVKEQWLRELPGAQREAAGQILSTPAAEQEGAAPEAGALVASLRSWLATQHHLVDPGAG